MDAVKAVYTRNDNDDQNFNNKNLSVHTDGL